MNTQSWVNGVPPLNSAGPMERAGFTEVPSSGMPTRWITVSTRPIARPAKPGAAARLVTRSTTRTSRKVMTTSTTIAPPRLTVLPYSLVPRAPVSSVAPPKPDTMSFSRAAATMPPMTWAIQYVTASRIVIPLRINTPSVTAGLT